MISKLHMNTPISCIYCLFKCGGLVVVFLFLVIVANVGDIQCLRLVLLYSFKYHASMLTISPRTIELVAELKLYFCCRCLSKF